MSETEFTPGPWKFLESFGRVETEQHVIAYIAGGVGSPHFNLDHAKANGALIAAAPELLEALDGLLDYLRTFWPDEPLFSTDDNKQSHDIYNAEAALRKAKGQ